jgi:predicted transcriptional regulator
MAGSALTQKFGATLKSWRNQLGISQEMLAERVNLHRTYISAVERAAHTVTFAGENIPGVMPRTIHKSSCWI